MVCKQLRVAFVLMIISIFLTETALGAAGWCYQCNSENPNCQFEMSPSGLEHLRIPCNGQCYTRFKDGIIYRGCSWEYGFMKKQADYSPMYLNETLWIFCDSPMCNYNPNRSKK